MELVIPLQTIILFTELVAHKQLGEVVLMFQEILLAITSMANLELVVKDIVTLMVVLTVELVTTGVEALLMQAVEVEVLAI